MGGFPPLCLALHTMWAFPAIRRKVPLAATVKAAARSVPRTGTAPLHVAGGKTPKTASRPALKQDHSQIEDTNLYLFCLRSGYPGYRWGLNPHGMQTIPGCPDWSNPDILRAAFVAVCAYRLRDISWRDGVDNPDDPEVNPPVG